MFFEGRETNRFILMIDSPNSLKRFMLPIDTLEKKLDSVLKCNKRLP